MTWRSHAFALFPASVLGGALIALVACWWSPWWLCVAIGWLYGVPVVAHRLTTWAWPVGAGVSRLRSGGFSPWWAAHQTQWVFIAFPALEAALRAVPGLFSAWLRLWGAQVGRGVVWAPGLVLADRGLLRMGDGVVLGEGVQISSHVVKPTDDGDLLCVVRPVCVERGAFLGAGATLGPGAKVLAGAMVGAGDRVIGRVVRCASPGP